MDESEAAYRLLSDLEQTLTGVRGRLADLLLLATGPEPPAEITVAPVGQGCAPELPQPLVLPDQVAAPGVTGLTDAAAEPVSAR